MSYSPKKAARQAQQAAQELAEAFQRGLAEIRKDADAAKDIAGGEERFAAFVEIKKKSARLEQETAGKIVHQKNALPHSADSTKRQDWSLFGGLTTAIASVGAGIAVKAGLAAAVGIGAAAAPLVMIGGMCISFSSAFSSFAGGKKAARKVEAAHTAGLGEWNRGCDSLASETVTGIQTAFQQILTETDEKVASIAEDIPEPGARYQRLMRIEDNISALKIRAAETTLPDSAPLLQSIAAQKSAILKNELDQLATSPLFDDLYDNVPAVKDAFIKASARQNAAPAVIRISKPAPRKLG